MEVLSGVTNHAFNYVDNFTWVTGTTPMTSVGFLVTVHIVYGIAITLLTRGTKAGKIVKPKWLNTFAYAHNMFMSFLSLIMLVGIIAGAIQYNRFSSVTTFGCRRTTDIQPGLLQFSMYIFYLSKMLEFIDTALLVLNGKNLIWLHKIHHLTTMSLVWHAMKVNAPSEIACAGLNCFVHVIMYFHFASPMKALRSSITATQIGQFLIVLGVLIYEVYQRVVHESPCQGTPLSEFHGIAMYGLYLGMFLNFFIQQYLKGNKNPKLSKEKVEVDEKSTNSKNAKALPVNFQSSNSISALLILMKTFVLLVTGILLAANLPEFVGAPIGIFLIAIAMSWIYMIGQDCVQDTFFGFSWANSFVGTIMLTPLLRPMAALSYETKRKDNVNAERDTLWFKRLLAKFLGLSISHFAVYAFLVSFVPLMIAKVSFWSLIKYWLLPFIIMHLNIGTMSTRKSCRPSYSLLFPQLGKLEANRPETNTLKRNNSHSDLSKVPVYNINQAADWMVRNIDKSIDSVKDEYGFLDTLWSYSGSQFVTRELLLWKKRDVFLYMSLGFSIIFTLNPEFSSQSAAIWCFSSLIALLPFVLINQSFAQDINLLSSRATKQLKGNPEKNIISKESLESNPEWIAIDGKVFDLVAFAPRHPGGDLILQAGGTEGSALFYSMHPYNTSKFIKILNKYQVGVMEKKEVYNFTFTSQFAVELKEEVGKVMERKGWYAGTGFWLRTVFIMTSTIITEYLWMTHGNISAMIITGILHAWIGLAVQHDASHGSFSKNPSINAFFSYGADWIGSSRWIWMQQHVIGHHPHTNIEHVDPDVHSAEPFFSFHTLHPKLRKWIYQYQYVYMFFVLPWYGVSVVYNVFQIYSLNHADETPKNDKWRKRSMPFAVFMRMLYVARIIVVPYFFADVNLVLALIGVPFITGAILSLLFVVSHNFEGSERFPLRDQNEGKNKVDWYKLQAETSCTYGGFWSMFFTGGLNFQIEHHLFPRMSSWMYPTIAPVVKKVCEKHNVKYAYYPSLLSNLKSCVTYMRLNGAENDARLTEYELHQYNRRLSEKAIDTMARDVTSSSQCYTSEDSLNALYGKDQLPITIDGETYNIKKWLAHHPGGDIILHYIGRDATEVFHAMHGKEAVKSLKRLPKLKKLPSSLSDLNSNQTTPFQGASQMQQKQIDLSLSPEQIKMNEDYNQMRIDFQKSGMLDASLVWYFYKTFTTLGLGVIGIFLYMHMGSSFVLTYLNVWQSTIISGLLIGLSFQQLGWLTHEFCHHCCFENRDLNKATAFALSFCQGLSVTWWNTRHNEHHAATNILEHDPDIENLPLFAWSEHDIKVAIDTWSPTWLASLRFQHFYYLPFTSTLHIIWELQSILYTLGLFKSTNKHYQKVAKIEALVLAGHWIWRIAFLYYLSPSFLHGLVNFLLTEMVSGSGIAIVVFCSHYPVDKVYDDAFKCFPENQIVTTVNMAPGIFNDWICGGLNYQIEHHLFPTMPRHNLSKAALKVQEFCVKHDLPYRAPPLIEAISDNVRYLKKMSLLIPESA